MDFKAYFLHVEIIIDPTPPLIYQAFYAILGIFGHIGIAGPWVPFGGPKRIFLLNAQNIFAMTIFEGL